MDAPDAPSAKAPSFKLRFAAAREPGRSHLSAVRPLALPAPVTDKFYARGWGGGQGAAGGAAGEGAEERALRRVHERFSVGPREAHARPVTSAHEYGWWCGGAGGGAAAAEGARTRFHVRDSAWLRTRLRLLAPDAAFKRR